MPSANEWKIRPWWEWIRGWILGVMFVLDGYLFWKTDVAATMTPVQQNASMTLFDKEMLHQNTECVSKMSMFLLEFPLSNMLLILLAFVADIVFWYIMPKVQNSVDNVLDQDQKLTNLNIDRLQIRDQIEQTVQQNNRDSELHGICLRLWKVQNTTSLVMLYVTRNAISYILSISSLWILLTVITDDGLSYYLYQTPEISLYCAFNQEGVAGIFLLIFLIVVFAALNLFAMLATKPSLLCEENSEIRKDATTWFLFEVINFLSASYMVYGSILNSIQLFLAVVIRFLWASYGLFNYPGSLYKPIPLIGLIIYLYLEWWTFLGCLHLFDSEVPAIIWQYSLLIATRIGVISCVLIHKGSPDHSRRQDSHCFHEYGLDGRFVFKFAKPKHRHYHRRTEEVLFPCKTKLSIDDVANFVDRHNN